MMTFQKVETNLQTSTHADTIALRHQATGQLKIATQKRYQPWMALRACQEIAGLENTENMLFMPIALMQQAQAAI